MSKIESVLREEQINQEADKLINLMIDAEFPIECMDKVFANGRLRPKNTREFMRYVIQYATEWNASIINDMDLNDIKKFENYFFFKTRTFFQMKKSLLVFCNAFPEFRSFTLDGIADKMRDKLNEENTDADYPAEYINTTPRYGGYLKPKPNITEPQTFFITQLGENDE
jgi:hypothetical protein